MNLTGDNSISPTNQTNVSVSRKRAVPDDQRKRALFSCDRCKMRKTKCRRVQNDSLTLKFDNKTPCAQCSKAGVECSTTIPRKKRALGSSENLGLHYKCLYALVKGLHPEKDVSNINHLIDLGSSLNIPMPSMEEQDDGLSNNLLQAHNELSASSVGYTEGLVYPNKPRFDNNHPLDTLFSDAPDRMSTVTQFNSIEPKNNNGNNENLIFDDSGNAHYIGSTGTPSILKGLGDVILKKQLKQRLSLNTDHGYTLAGVQFGTPSPAATSSNNDSTGGTGLNISADSSSNFLSLEKYPIFTSIPREEADYYIDTFFDNIHPIYFIFSEKHFRERYEYLWNKDKIKSEDTSLSVGNAEICAIFLVLMMGKSFKTYEAAGLGLDDHMSQKFLEILRLSLSDFVCSPTLNGLKTMYLLSIYLFSNKNRESSWIVLSVCAIQLSALGYHRESLVSNFPPEKAEDCRMIFWNVFRSLQTLGSNFGRGSVLKNDEIDVEYPKFNDDTYNKDPEFKVHMTESFKLSRILNKMIQIRSKNSINQKMDIDILSSHNIERNLVFAKELNAFFENLPYFLKNYKEEPLKRYKLKMNIQYNYYFMILTLPFILYIVKTNHKLSKEDPIMTILIDGICAAIKTSEILLCSKEKGFLNGTIYLDIFYGYVSTLLLILSYILLSNPSNSVHSRNNLLKIFDSHGINPTVILNSINNIRMCKDGIVLEGTMVRMGVTTDYLLEELGINDELNYLAKKSKEAKENGVNTDGNDNESRIALSPPHSTSASDTPNVHTMNENMYFKNGMMDSSPAIARFANNNSYANLSSTRSTQEEPPSYVNNNLNNYLNHFYSGDMNDESNFVIDNELVSLLFGGDIFDKTANRGDYNFGL